MSKAGKCRTMSNPPREHSPTTLRADIALSYPPTSNMPAPVPTSSITAGSLAQPPNPAQPPAPGKAQAGGGAAHTAQGCINSNPVKIVCPSPLPKGSCFQKEGLKTVRSVDASPAKPQLQNDLEGEGWHCSGRCWASLLQIEVLAAPPTVCLAAAGENGLSSIEVLSQSPRLPPH